MSTSSKYSRVRENITGESIVLDVQTKHSEQHEKVVTLVFGTKDNLTFAIENQDDIKNLIQALKNAACDCWPQLRIFYNDQIDPELDRALGGFSKYPFV